MPAEPALELTVEEVAELGGATGRHLALALVTSPPYTPDEERRASAMRTRAMNRISRVEGRLAKRIGLEGADFAVRKVYLAMAREFALIETFREEWDELRRELEAYRRSVGNR